MTHDGVMIPVSVGELCDKITILGIKSQKITNKAKLRNINTELFALNDVLSSIVLSGFTDEMRANIMAELRDVNQQLWDVEDHLRRLERDGSFGARFVELARSVYKLNDHRARIKREINALFFSTIVEEKEYVEYD